MQKSPNLTNEPLCPFQSAYTDEVEAFVKGALTNGQSGSGGGGGGLPEEIGGVKTSEMPGPEALSRPGNREGQTKMIRQGNNVSVHSWSASEFSALNILDEWLTVRFWQSLFGQRTEHEKA